MVSDPGRKQRTRPVAHRRSRSCCRSARRSCRRCSGSGRSSRSPALVAARRRPRPGTRRSTGRSAATSRRRSTSGSSRTSSSSRRAATPAATRSAGSSPPPILGLVPSNVDPALPPDTQLAPGRRLPALAFDHRSIVLAGASACAASSPTRTSASRSHRRRFTISELRDLYRAALGHDLSATNLLRVLLRRQLLVPTGEPPRARAGRVVARPRCFASASAPSRSPTSSPCCDRRADTPPLPKAMSQRHLAR